MLQVFVKLTPERLVSNKKVIRAYINDRDDLLVETKC